MMTTCLQLINLLISVCLVGLYCNYTVKRRAAKTLNFTIDDNNTPVMTVIQDDMELNFIIDTGSSVSAIDANSLNSIRSYKLSKTGQVVGIDGIPESVDYYEIPFSYNNYEYNHTFGVKDFSLAFKSVEENLNKPIHGLIGSDFCNENGFIINFQTKEIHAN